MENKKTFYYSNAQNEDFLEHPKAIKSIKGDYLYVEKKWNRRLLSFIAYRLIATPIAFVYSRIVKRVRFENRKVLKPYLKKGYFVYGNHTQIVSDALTPNIVIFPKRNYTVVSSDNVSLPVLGNATKLLGALPLPEDLSSSKNFLKAIETRIKQGHSVLIYPEAHVWPFYTKIRPFDDSSFKYPIKHDAPSFVFTTTYQKKRHGGLKIIVYIDGPFRASPNLDKKEQQRDLHQQVIETMRHRSLKSNYEKYQYFPKEQL